MGGIFSGLLIVILSVEKRQRKSVIPRHLHRNFNYISKNKNVEVENIDRLKEKNNEKNNIESLMSKMKLKNLKTLPIFPKVLNQRQIKHFFFLNFEGKTHVEMYFFFNSKSA